MYCNKCGNLVQEEDLFCSKCGNKINKIENEEVIIEDKSVANYNMYSYNDTTPKENIIIGESFYNQQDNNNDSNQYYNYQGNQSNSMNQKKETVGFAITSMVLGIISILFTCSYIYGSILSILALIFGIIHLRTKKSGNGMAVAGVTTAAVSLAIKIIIVVLMLVGAISARSRFDFENIFDEFEDYDNYDDYEDYDNYDLNSKLGEYFYIDTELIDM